MDQTKQTKKSPRKLNWKAFFVGLLIVIVIEILAFRLLQVGDPHITKPQETAQETFQPYVNPVMGFSVNLPHNWSGNSETRSGEKVQADLWAPKQEARISVVQYPSDGTDLKIQAQQWLESVEQTSPNTYNKELQMTTVGGKEAVVIQSEVKHTEYIYVSHGDYTYYLTLSTPTNVPFEKYQTVFNQILTSFRFTN